MTSNKLIIGCPVLNDLESLKEMIKSLYESTSINYNLVFVIGENCNQETIDHLTTLPFKEGVSITVLNLQTKTPLEAYNKLFEIAKAERSDLLLIQTDVLFTKLYKRDWLDIMRNISRNRGVGAVIPINGGGVSGPDYINGLEWIGGWCTYIPYKTLEKDIKFDMDFPNGYGVDIDLTVQINQAKLKIAKMNYWVDHHMMNERLHDNNPNAEQMKQEASKYFKNKWQKKNESSKN